MFIRRTKTRSTIPGKEYYTHRLVRSERIGKKVQQRSLLNLGRHFDIDQKHWPDLCARRLSGNSSSSDFSKAW